MQPSPPPSPASANPSGSRLDPHSYTDASQPRADHLTWRARVEFASRRLRCEAVLRLREPAPQAGPIDLDSRDLDIQSVTDQAGRPLAYELGAPEPILGSRLRIQLRPATQTIQITYVTSPEATALQWLEPAQTAGGRQPFLYTQCQPIHARSVVPLQDTPTTRLRFDAQLIAPRALTALMAARRLGTYPDGDVAVSHFTLPEPIAPYLLAFAVGLLERRELGPRSRVWAEAELIEPAAWEFAETERVLATGESLFGPYDWERYDLLVLPPSFPYGGMENPRLTFLTPSVVAGDRSAVSVIAHELAHSWTGNLISNANAEHFWLNEGGATYAERRIVEALWGADAAALDWALGRRELDEAMTRLEHEGRPQLTCLRTHLAGIDPDEAYTVVPYEKGALLLRALEEACGRQVFDAFLRRYIESFRFGALTTEQFVEFASTQLPAAALERVDPDDWLYQPGLPPQAAMGALAPVSARLEAINRLGGAAPDDGLAQTWSATEWQLWIESIPRDADPAVLEEFDRRFDLSQRRNDDILTKWLTLCVEAGYTAVLPRVEELLGRVGRMKYLRPLYRALAQRPETRARARELFERYAPRYHPIARHVVATVLA